MKTLVGLLTCLGLLVGPVLAEAPIAGYQVGAFTDKAHAQVLLKKLGEHDIDSEVRQKTVGDRQYWVVLVPASDIPFENVQQKLLDAGFPSFPVTRDRWEAQPAPPRSGS